MRGRLLLPLVLVLPACGRSAPAAGEASVAETRSATLEEDAGFTSAAGELAPSEVEAGGARSLGQPPAPGERLQIPEGTFASGSMPGDEGRQAAIEPALVDVRLGAFAIDALPYPNDPSRPPRLASSQAEAEELCGERGARLCTELEWERACKGPDGDRFATGPAWNPDCDRAPSRCASGFGVRALGFMHEWTGSRATVGASADVAVVRGGPAHARRCAARAPASAKGLPASMAFRCCTGDRNDAAVAAPEAKPSFRRTDLDAAALTRIFAEIPELRRIGDDVRLFEAPDVRAVIARAGGSKSGDDDRARGISFATQPILWSPEPGLELLVTTGRAKRSSFVVALWTLPDGKYRFASSFVFLGDPSPVVLAWEPSHRKELRWSACWGCAGEQGAVSLRDDGRVVIVHY